MDNMHGYSRIRTYSSGSDDSSKDYGYTHSDEFLAAIQQTQGENCIRCQTKVYPTEKVEVGVQMHKNCFRCRECGLTLSLHNFILARVGLRGYKDVFCKAHAPRTSKNAMDPQAIGIKNAVHSQQILNKRESFNAQIRLNDISGWQYDPKAIEFEHAKVLQERNKQRRPLAYDQEADDLEYEKGDLIRKLRMGELRSEKVKEIATTITDDVVRSRLPRREEPLAIEEMLKARRKVQICDKKFPKNTDYMEPNAIWSPNQVEDPWNPKIMNRRDMSNGYGHEQNYMCENLIMNDQIEYIRQDTIDQPIGSHAIYGSTPGPKGNPNFYPPERIYEKLNILRPDESIMAPKAKESKVENGYHQRQRHQSPEKKARIPGAKQNYENCGLNAPVAGRITVSRHKVPPEYRKEKKFLEQNELELRQRQEHEAMIKDLEMARENQIRKVEQEIKQQAESALSELFTHMDSGSFQGDINLEKMRIEQRFRRLKDEKMKYLMSNLTSKERIRVDDMIDRQTQEMLELIDKKVPKKMPSPKPPKKRKRGMYSGPQIFDDVDFNAIQVAQYEQESFTELVYELTRGCKNALEKVRAIFRWLTFKNLNQMMFSEDLTEESPYYFLKGIKYGLESYHQLFKRLCSYTGLTVHIIRGFSKSAGYRPGMPFADGRFRNSWAAVYIDGYWRFIDCHWGARHVSKPNEIVDPQSFCYEMDEFYFLTDPEDMIYMHFPDDPEWQLLDKKFSLEQFVSLPVVKSHFFHYGIRFNGHLSSILDTDTGKLEIILNNSNKECLTFSARLEADGEELDGFCIHHYQGRDVIFNLTLPRKGVFFLTLFSCDKDKGDIYNNICSFRVVCTRVEVKPFSKFPRLPDGYGLTNVGQELGLVAEKLDEYYFVCNDDKMTLNIKFRCPVRVSQKLAFGKSNGDVITAFDVNPDKELELDRLVFQRFKDHCFVSYLIRFPERGIYVFSVFGGYSESKSQCLDCACRYLIQCNKRASSIMRMFPKTMQYWHKCRLHEPTVGQLKLNKNVKFKVEVAKAEAVAVIVGQQWFYLKKDESRKTWEGVAHMGKDCRVTADVYARYTDNDKDFFPLLEYKLIKDDK